MRILLTIAAGGALGALLRYAISGFATKTLPGPFPIGTLTVNLIGSFLIGSCWVLVERLNGAPHLRAFAVVGLLGAFTTFSTYSLETLMLCRFHDLRMAVANIVASNLLCVGAAAAGFFLARVLSGAT